MKNIDDTRTVYDYMESSPDDSGERKGYWFRGCFTKFFKTKEAAEKFRADLIRFVEGYK